MRAGQYVRQVEGYQAFIPAPLPPQPPPQIDQKTLNLLSRADLALGRLDGVTSILPNPDLFVAMFVRQEAVLSSQIEGTQSTLAYVARVAVEIPRISRESRRHGGWVFTTKCGLG
jgi:Fic family protein